MSKYSKVGKVAKCGSPDSKYFGDVEQFERDVEKRLQKGEQLQRRVRNTLRDLILQEPERANSVYHLVIEELISIKAEFEF